MSFVSLRPILYHAPRTESSGIKWLIHEIEEQGLKDHFIIKTINLQIGENRTEDFAVLNPHCTVPTYQNSEGQVLTEPTAIYFAITYAYSKSHNLLPKEKNMDMYYQWVCYAASLHDTLLLLIREQQLDKNSEKIGPIRDKLTKRLEYLEWNLGTQDYFIENFTTCDIALGYNLIWAKLLGELENYQILDAYVERLGSRKAFHQTFSKEFKL
jgi:glutathione S-transferase